MVTTDRGRYEAGRLILAAGAWMADLDPALAPVAVPERQVLAWFATTRPEWFAPARFPVCNLQTPQGHFYGLPEYGVPGFKFGLYHHLHETGHPDSLRREPDAQDEAVLRAGAERYFPHGAGPAMALRDCMFTNTPDGHFLVGLHPHHAQVVLASPCSGPRIQVLLRDGRDPGRPRDEAGDGARHRLPDPQPLPDRRLMPPSPAFRPSTAHAALGEVFFDVVAPADFPQAVLRHRDHRWAARIGLDTLTDAEWDAVMGRFQPIPGSHPHPLALRYHGHQFRHYNPDLGDGRGFLFAQLHDLQDGRLLDLGTKGSGTTPWSRAGDGRLTLKGGVREVLATEMLEAQGVYTSKSLSLIETGEDLVRHDEPSPTRSAVLVRLNHSHIRIGSFQRQPRSATRTRCGGCWPIPCGPTSPRPPARTTPGWPWPSCAPSAPGWPAWARNGWPPVSCTAC